MAGFPNLAAALAAFNQASGQNLTQQNWGAVDPKQMPQWAGLPAGSKPQSGQAEFNSWLANIAHSGKVPGYTQPGDVAAPNTASSAAPAGPAISPTFISSLLGGSIPQAQAVTAGGVPSIGADPISAMMLGATPSTGDITNAISSNLLPQFGQQDQALNEQLANLGIIGGSSTGALAALGRQQQSQLTSDISPYVMQGYQLAEQNAQGNQQAYNSAQLANQGNNLASQQQNQQAALGLGEFNANATNTSNQFNITNLLQSAGMDANTANQFVNNVMGYQNQDWNNLLSANANLQQSSAAAQSGAAQPVYQQPNPGSGFANFGNSIAGSFAQPNAVPQTNYNTTNSYTPKAPGDTNYNDPYSTGVS